MFRCSFALAMIAAFAWSISLGTPGLAVNRSAHGVLFRGGFNPSGSAESVIYALTRAVDGAAPRGNLIRDAAGALYGVTANGGLAGAGTVFKLTPPARGKTAWTETVLHSFSFSTTPHGEGCDPVAGLLAYGGELYGTTYGCGPGRFGTVYRLTPPAAGRTAWTLSVLHAFADSPDGANPEGRLIEYRGSLYSTTFFGGTFRTGCNGDGCGTVFRLAPPAPGKTAWTESVIHSFNKRDGANPEVGLIVDTSGTLYGSTLIDGSRGAGNVFSLRPPAAGQPNWTLTELYAFADATASPAFPAAPLLAFRGALYGTTIGGGAHSVGTIFKLSPPAGSKIQWNASILYSFGNSASDGAAPATLSVDANDNFYGTTLEGGSANFGTVFKLAPPASGLGAWKESITHSFSAAEGTPFGALSEFSLGTFYGTTNGNGPSFGTVYKINM